VKLQRSTIALGVILALGWWGRWEAGTVVQDAINPVPGGDLDTLARTIWGEARGEGVAGMTAVACVIANRVKRPGWWGRGWEGVCRKAWQFSCWNPLDPNREKLASVGTTDTQFRIAWDIATRAINGTLADTTGGADHYHEKSVRPDWVDTYRRTAIIGNHVFYRSV
jgi:spore germination cell wall hydrolase CwlJ-like protein